MSAQEEKQQYLQLMSDIIRKQAVILGPEIAVLRARAVKGLIVTNDGTVTDFSGNAQDILERMIDAYVELSGQIVKSALTPIFEKYPSIKRVR